MGDKYVLSRSEEESARLERQHRLWRQTLGYNLHPSVEPLVGASGPAAVAELATGTSIWLREVADDLGPSASLVGFDISAEQFPKGPGAVPSNVRLEVANATAPLPAEWAGRFDAVHIRLLIGGLPTRDDWLAVARNALFLLRPGGALQWDEGDYSLVGMELPARKPGATKAGAETALKLTFEGMGGDMVNGFWSQLPDILAEAGFESVKRDAVSCDVDPSIRDDWNEVVTGAYLRILWNLFDMGRLKPEWTKEKIEELVEEEQRDIKSGTDYKWDLLVFTAFKAKA